MRTLTAVAVKAAPPGRHVDGDGLLLIVRANGSRFWSLRVMKDGKRAEHGLGSFPAVSLADARAKAAKLRADVKAGVDVLADKRAAKAVRVEAAARTFAAVADMAHAQRTFRTERLRARWINRLKHYAFPHFGHVAVDKVMGPMVLAALEPIWRTKPETARRVRQLTASVLDYAHAMGWRGPSPGLVTLTKQAFAAHDRGPVHHPAVDYAAAAAVLAKLRAAPESVGRLALLFTIYTAARSGETRLATWGEVDLAKALWSIPAVRMKMARDHVVPLTAPALAILETMAAARLTDDPAALIFPGAKAGRPLSDMTMAKAHKLAAPGTVPHGWRSTFRDWAGETTAFPTDVVEMALAHQVGTSTTQAYQRGNLLDKRREVMTAWAAFVEPEREGVARLARHARVGA